MNYSNSYRSSTHIPAGSGPTEMMNDSAGSVRVQLDAMHELGQVADEGMTIAIYIHLIPR